MTSTRTPARLALLGDIHANHPALVAVLGAIEAAGITRGACTGDLVMRGVSPIECIDEIRRRDWPCARGNTDHKVATRPPRPPDHPKSKRPGSRSWTAARLPARDVRYLAELPVTVRIDFEGVRVVVVHGGPNDPYDAVTSDTSDADMSRLAREADADVLVMGHVHRQLVRRVDGCLFVNPGSVGEATDGDLRPRWAWLERTADGVAVHMERVEEPLATIRQR